MSHFFLFFCLLSRVQRRKQGGILPTGAEVQVLQPRVLQTDVLQDVPRTLTYARRERKIREREREREREGEGEKTGERLKTRPAEEKRQSWGRKEQKTLSLSLSLSSSLPFSFPLSHTCSPALWSPDHCSACAADTSVFMFTSVKWEHRHLSSLMLFLL